MGAAYFIVLERKIDGLDTMMDGKSLAHAIETLDAAATRLGVTPLSNFFSIDPEQAAEFLLEEGGEGAGIELPPLQQFSAQAGLATVRALLAHLQAKPRSVKDAEGVVGDLRECERILSAAAEHGIGWHFEVDF